MKTVKIDQLFQAAKAAPAGVAQPMPEHMATRVIAAWNSGDALVLSAIDLFPSLRLMFRWGLGVAAGVMLGCLAWSYHELTYEPQTYIDVATIDTHAEVDAEL
jgi:hypothetical protein